MAGTKTTTYTNVYRSNATDTKKLAKLCGADISPQSDKLIKVEYVPYITENAIFLLPGEITFLKKEQEITATERREFALIERLIAAGIATNDDMERYDKLKSKATGVAHEVFFDGFCDFDAYSSDMLELLTPYTMS